MSKTKEKIITAALKLFNQNGVINVRLQHIADEAFVSVGNMAYHYHNKEAILYTLYETITEQQKGLLAEYRIVPLFDTLNRLFQRTFRLQQAYIFFYLDTLEIIRAYPKIGDIHQKHISFQVSQLAAILDFNVARGALITEPRVGLFNQLALQIWMTVDYWHNQQSVRGDKEQSEKKYLEAVWALLIPYFTNMGKQEYEQMLQNPYEFYF
ncbi:MAG: TetR/AcrR family transcriptional regulator [Bacteroidota bacterium]